MTTHTATELTSPHDLLAAVPFMVGYHPKDSLVVMALVNSKVTMAMRVDFPDSENMASESATPHMIFLVDIFDFMCGDVETTSGSFIF